MNKVKNQTAQRILDLALEIIYLLTGEDHMVVKIPELVHDNNSCQISEGCNKAHHHSTEPPLHSLIHMRNNEQKILELTNKIIRLLSGEVPIRCEDVTVYLSMEEWEYLEGHKELYKDVMMEDHQPIVSPVDNFSPGEFHTPVSLPGFGTKNGTENETDNGEKYLKITETIEGPAKSARNAKREPLAFEDRSVIETEINVTTKHSQTEYPPIDIKEEPDSCEDDLTESDLYKHRQYTQAEPDMCGVRYIADPDLYPSTKHKQTKYIHGNLEGYLTGNTSLLEKMPSMSFIESSEQKKLFKCRECGKCFPQNYKLIIHLRVHTGERPFKCTECGKCFTRASYLAAHKMIHTGEKPFRCTDCGKCFTRALSLATHKLIHTGEKTFNCTECDKCFTRASSLVRHKIIHTGEKPFKCSECERCFTWGSDLRRHKMIHTGKKPFNCTECGKCFTQASDLATHKIIHTGEKPYKCTECEKCFSWASDLTRHKMIHTGEKPHNCTECGKSFSQGSDLVRHKMIHNGEKPFKCNVCGKGFPRNDHAIWHQRLHMRDKPFNFS